MISVASKAKVAIGVSLLREFITITALDLYGQPIKEKYVTFPLSAAMPIIVHSAKQLTNL